MENKNLLIFANQFPNQRNPLGGIWIKRKVEELKFNKIYIISLIPYMPRFMSRFSFIPKRMRKMHMLRIILMTMWKFFYKQNSLFDL